MLQQITDADPFATHRFAPPRTKQSRLDGLAFHTLPHSYRENSAKEEAVLEYVENFRRQFVLLFPARRELMLCPVNECGVRKFVCSTIRPSKLANDEIYDLQSAANFVADFFEYAMLENPTQMPDLLPSPGSIVKLRAGDCYDLSHVLVTMLRGSGYDAYVVSGYAPLWITRADQSKVQARAAWRWLGSGRSQCSRC